MSLTLLKRPVRVRRSVLAGVMVALVIAGSWWAVSSRADGAGQSFMELAPGFTQELFGVTGDLDLNNPLAILGGVAFAPDADVWSSECVFLGTRLHRFDRHAGYTVNTTPLHPEMVVDLTFTDFGPAGGCGLVNHPDGFLYSNSATGVWKLNAETGQPVGPAIGQGGNALGIALDPQNDSHLVYVGDDCHPTLAPDSLTCTFWDLDPTTGTAAVFARFTRNESAFVDGIYFDPTGELVFGAYREFNAGTGEEHHSLLVLRRPDALKPVSAPADDSQIVRQVAMVAEPDGVAFHAATGAVVTLNESPDCVAADGMTLVPPVSEVLYDEFGDPYATVKSCPAGSTAIGGTMSVFNFPGGDYTAAPTQGLFAKGGFRGDLTQVGADGCIYATQGALFEASQNLGARYNDGTETPENSIVRICGGFIPPPGVTGTVSAQVFTDLTCNGVSDAGDALGGVIVTLTSPTGTVVTGTTNASGAATFEGLIPGTYTVSIPDEYVGENAPPSVTSVEVAVTTGQTTAATFDFTPLVTISGRLFEDTDGNGVYDLGELGLTSVTVAVTGTAADGTPVSTSAITNATGSYTVTGLSAGNYTVTVPTTVGTATTTTPATPVTLAACVDGTVNVPYTPADEPTGDLSGTVYVDANRNGVRDGGEPGIPGVTVTLAGAGSATTTSAGDGSYSFSNLDAGSYTASAPATAAGKALFTPSPLNVDLAAGASSPNHDFGYVTGALSGTVFTDVNRNGTRDGGEPGIGGVTIALGGAGSATTTSAGDGSYSFANLDAGSYTVSSPTTAAGKALFTPSPLSVNLAAGASSPNNNFGYVQGGLSGFTYLDANGNGSKDSGEAGIGGVVIVLNGGATATTAADGSYTFSSLDAATYSVAAPATASGYDRSTPSPLSVPLAAGQIQPNVNFGYTDGAVGGDGGPFCEKQTVQSELNPAGTHYPGNHGPDTLVRVHRGESIQAAIDNASDLNGDGFILVAVVAKDGAVLGGTATQSVMINRTFTLPFGLFACSVTIVDPTPSDANPTARIASAASAPPDAIGARIFVMDLHANGSNVAGWLVEGNNRYLRNVEARNNLVGVKFVGNSNTMHNGAVENNQGVGLSVQGNTNKVDSTDVFSNAGHGILVTGNTNQILKTDVGEKNKGNGGDGVHVEGAGNTISETSAFANLGDGIEVVAATGSPNVLIKNVSGDKSGKGNAGNGILIAGPGNGTASPIELDQNTVKANGVVGIRITGTGHQLKNNVSGGTGSGETNVGCEFNVAAGNVNATGNKANGTTISGSNGSAFPTSCVGN